MDTGISRRRFLGYAGIACLACAGNAYGFFSDKDISGTVFKGQAPKEPWKWSIEGFHYRKVGTDKVQCMVCPNKCFTTSRAHRVRGQSLQDLDGQG